MPILLSDLLDTESRFRQQHEHVERGVRVVDGHSEAPAQSKAPNLRHLNTPPIIMCRHCKREAAAQEYQKALLDLWQADNSLCHWLTRYIRTARRVSRNLDLMLLDSSAARGVLGSPVSLDKNAVVVLVARPSGVLTAVHPATQSSSSTFDLVSTTLPHVDEVSRSKGQWATLRHASADDDKTPQSPDPVRTCSPRVSHRSAPSAHSLLRLPFQAPTTPPPPVSIAGGNRMVEKRFEDYDELEATVFVGRHLQSLQKANEFLYRFDREASHSTIVLERFENAREVYRRRVHQG
ncbi:hypothetical protein BGZ70_000685 [Mortierella alpina]|uniref:Uncharacterized protein n=1 Tax=Mortierella alpina TaxID=64518 RepID=A0A9P6JFH4_MORAP|nr:hypothetical protein BGZ70_000685 [Mortierella alpina]